MPDVRIEWTRISKPQFEYLQKRAVDRGQSRAFARAHNEVVASLRDLDQALEKGEVLFRTRNAGGEVRHWVHRFISVVIFADERVGWILRYQPFPEDWPE